MIGDVLWKFKKDYQSAEVAILAYQDYAKRTDSSERWVEPVYALTRALNLAKSLRKKPEISNILEYIEKCVTRKDGQDSLFYSNRLIHLLIDNDYGDINQFAQLAEKLAKNEEGSSEPSWSRAEEHWKLAERCYQKLGDEDSARQAIINSAETWVKAANLSLKNPNLVRFQVTYQLEKAIHIYRSISDTQERVGELHRQLLKVQKEAKEQMVSTSVSLKDNPEVEKMRHRAIEAVTAQDFLSSFLKFARLQPPLSFDMLVESAKAAEERYVLKKLFPTRIVDGFGRTIANPPRSQDETLLADVFQSQNIHRQGIVSIAIEPARQEILHTHIFTLQDLAPIANSNPFIPQAHEYAVLKGIVAGLQGDFLTASHLLVPQLEATLRHILLYQGEITSKYTDKGVQDEISLNKMLEEKEFFSAISQVLGKDTSYDLRGLLVDRFGANFRNNLAHGLLFDGQFFDAQSIYLWYLAVNIYSRPLILSMLNSSDEL